MSRQMPEHEKLSEFIDEMNPSILDGKKDLIVSKSIYSKLIEEAHRELGMPLIFEGTYNFYGFRILNGGSQNPIYQL